MDNSSNKNSRLLTMAICIVMIVVGISIFGYYRWTGNSNINQRIMQRASRNNSEYSTGLSTTGDGSMIRSGAQVSGAYIQHTGNPFGVLVNDGDGSIPANQKASITKDLLHVPYVRGNIIMGRWNGDSKLNDAYINVGLKVLLNINYSAGSSQFGPMPFATEKDIPEFKKVLNSILDVYKPEVVVLENEESNKGYHSGPISDYILELKAAIDIAHSKGLKITNGGIVSGLAKLLVWHDYVERGMTKEAKDFAIRTFPARDFDKNGDLDILKNKKASDSLQEGLYLINEYKNSNLDYVNFHWYEPIARRDGQTNTSDVANIQHIDTKALQETIAYFRRVTGKEVITNEIGQLNQQPTAVTDILTTLASSGMPYIIWYSGDGGDGKAIALHNPDGSLRDSGKAFGNFMLQTY